MITQVNIYFATHKKWVFMYLREAPSNWCLTRDRRWLKYMVVFLLLVDTVNAVFDLIYIYDSLILNFGASFPW